MTSMAKGDTCGTCNGTGEIKDDRHGGKVTCPVCQGTGKQR